jgi:hypothetical protein
MPLPEIVLRQRHLLTFFNTTLLIALTTQSSLAFNIKPLGPQGATQSWIPTKSYNLPNQRRGTTTLSPMNVHNLNRGGGTGLWRLLLRDFPNWTFAVSATPLAGSFEVKKYEAIGTATEVGANLLLQYTPGIGDPTPRNSTLNWIQWVVSNHSDEGHGDREDVIDNAKQGLSYLAPFYFFERPFAPPTNNYSYETNFSASSRMNDSGFNHDWLAETYLVQQTGFRTATIYNGIQWGWENRVQRVESVPEPLTIFAAGISLGFGAFFKKTVKAGGQSKTKALKS